MTRIGFWEISYYDDLIMEPQRRVRLNHSGYCMKAKGWWEASTHLMEGMRMSFRRIFYCRRVSSTKRGGMTKDRDPPTKFIKLEIIASVLLGCVVEGIRVGVSNLALASFRDGHSALHLATTATTTATATATTRTTTTTTRTTTTTATTTTAGTGTGAGTANANWNANPPGQQQEHLHQHILLPLLLLRLLSSRCCNSSE